MGDLYNFFNAGIEMIRNGGRLENVGDLLYLFNAGISLCKTLRNGGAFHFCYSCSAD